MTPVLRKSSSAVAKKNSLAVRKFGRQDSETEAKTFSLLEYGNRKLDYTCCTDMVNLLNNAWPAYFWPDNSVVASSSQRYHSISLKLKEELIIQWRVHYVYTVPSKL